MTVTRRLVSGMLPSASAPKSERGLVICLATPSFPSLASGFLTLDTVFVGVRAYPPRFRSPMPHPYWVNGFVLMTERIRPRHRLGGTAEARLNRRLSLANDAPLTREP